ncbi:hypothetical protein NPIL_699121 [Nephila pilipes]|uniref:Reverse transcriptase n=1 Tax=Nephila pilipes TaxID=299642 RepID=A0A8X6NF88_NEPPI|nr:hypothetical protein NPIL_699121 [Nephila pilipes]
MNTTEKTAQKRFLNDIFSIEELRECIGSLKRKKQSGTDNIFPGFLKHHVPEAQNILLPFYNTFWNEMTIIRTDWVRAIVIPIHKKGKRINDLVSYRPI